MTSATSFDSPWPLESYLWMGLSLYITPNTAIVPILLFCCSFYQQRDDATSMLMAHSLLLALNQTLALLDPINATILLVVDYLFTINQRLYTIPTISVIVSIAAITILTIIPLTSLSTISTSAIYFSLWQLYSFMGQGPNYALTRGETKLYTALAAWGTLQTPTTVLSTVVAQRGTLACILTTILTNKCFKASKSIYLQLLTIIIPLLVIECTIDFTTNNNNNQILPLPRSIQWLHQFLLQTEHHLPRYIWILYWSLLVPMAIATAPTASTNVVVARKWFHGVAVVLFAPVTLDAPQLQALAYAIALCLLVTLETIRTNVPSVQRYYQRYLDPQKREELDNTLVVSHLALLLGCAMPLWLAQYSGQVDSIVLTLWGVMALGIGDACGAIVGTYCGRHRWPGQSRTIEGSLAFWITTCAACWFIEPETWRQWTGTTTVVTLIEAWTAQMDNLVLPLAGAVMLLSTKTR